MLQPFGGGLATFRRVNMAALAPLASSLLQPAIAPPQGGDVHSTRTLGDDAEDAASHRLVLQQRAAVETQTPPPPRPPPRPPPPPLPPPQPPQPQPPQPLPADDGAKPHGGAIPARSNQQDVDDMLGLLRIFVYSTIALVTVLCVVTLLFVYHSFRR